MSRSLADTRATDGPAGPEPSDGASAQRSATNQPPQANSADAVRPTAIQPVSRVRRISTRLWILAIGLIVIGTGIFRFLNTPSLVPADLLLPGNIDVRQVNLSFKVSGRIESLTADEGDFVTAGQVYATLEKRYFDDSLRLALAQRDQARANLDRLKNGSRPEEIEQAQAQTANTRAALARADQDFIRAKQLIEKKIITSADYDVTKAAYLEAQAALNAAEASQRLVEIGPRVEDIAAGQAQFDAAEAQVIVTQRQLADAELLAPHDGIILTRAREVGAIVNAGETVATLTLSSPIWVRTYIGEADLGRIAPGMEVTVATDNPAGRKYAGKVGFISPTAEFTPKSVETRELRTSLVYRVRIVIDDADAGLRQGMPVTVSISLPGMRDRPFSERIMDAMGLGK